jgi:biotin operon repressor
MTTEEKILALLKQNSEPMSAGQLAENSGIDRKTIDKAMKSLKESGSIVSPRKCYWTIK